MKNNKMEQQKRITQDLTGKSTGRKWLLFTFSTCFLMNSVYASDVEIYRQGTDGGNTTIMLMVDTSRAMGSSTLDLVKEYPLCIGGGILSILNSNIGGVLKVGIAPESENTQYCDIVLDKTLLNTLTGVDGLTGSILQGLTGNHTTLLGLKSSYDYVQKSCTPFSQLDKNDTKPDQALLSVKADLGEGYRCYSRLQRIKNAVNDVLNGRDADVEKGISAILPLPNDMSVGLTVFSSTNKNAAGMIVVPANKLGAKGSAQRNALIAAVNNLEPTGLDGTTRCITKLLSPNLDLAGTASCLLGGGLNNGLNVLLNKAEVPTAPAYAETGAYLLGRTTKYTGAKVVGATIKVTVGGTLQTVTGTVTKLLCDGIPIAGPLLCGIFGKLTEVTENILSPVTNIVDKLATNLALNRTCISNDQTTGECKTWGIVTLSNTNNFIYDYTKQRSVAGDIVAGIGLNSLVEGLLPAGSIVTGLTTNLDNLATYYYQYDDTYDAAYSGFTDSIISSKDGNTAYQSPLSDKKLECEAQGIYIITGNVPRLDDSQAQIGVQRIMQKSLGLTPAKIKNYCNGIPVEWAAGSNSATWECIYQYSESLKGLSIKTAVAGIGREFTYVNAEDDKIIFGVGGDGLVAQLVSQLTPIIGTLLPSVRNLLDFVLPTAPNAGDIGNLARWGVNGQGGWYSEASTGGIAQSIIDFSQNLSDEESEPFMGLQTTPADPLTPYQMNNEVYNSMFEPTDHQSWFGNLKKYSVTNPKVGDNTIRMLDWKDKWNNDQEDKQAEFKLDKSKLFEGGMLKQLETYRPSKNNESTRKLWINRNCKKDGTFGESENLKAITKAYASDISVERCTDNSSAKDNRQYETGYLMSLLGYKIDPEKFLTTQLDQSEPLWQIGMSLHSTPFKITQNATFQSNGSIDRNDYIIFGSTQGLLHVVNASDGKEKFAFVPNEMLENTEQRKAFTSERKGNWRNMPYGIDGAWTAYTEYAYGMDSNGKIYATVGEAKNKQGSVIATGKQVIYGGLRMGGRSYYALDLANLDNPILKFHINPTGACSSSTPLGCMGQSWSKPTIAYVNWRGVRTRVMFIGGGYDMGYEAKDYNQGNSVGAGVYMFSTDDIKGKDEKGEEITKVKAGELLWWASSKADSKNDGNKEHSLNVLHMDYSVVSRINTADRDGDGLVDHLYFGDLGGQVWRIDLNANTAIGDFAKRATRILNLHQENGSSPRFYDAPNFTVYGYEQPLAVISIASGNRSLPASDESSGAIYNIFDRDVTKTNLYTLSESDLETKDINLSTDGKKLVAMLTASQVAGKTLDDIIGSKADALMSNGWTIAFDGSKKVMDEMAIVNKNLYASIYDPGKTPTCPVQVRGETNIHRYCLPFGICEQNIPTQVSSFAAGKGIVALNIGAGSTDSKNQLQSRALINNGSASPTTQLPVNNMRRQIVPLKWYERNE